MKRFLIVLVLMLGWRVTAQPYNQPGGGGGVTLTQVTNTVNALAITVNSATNIVYTNSPIVIASPAAGNNAFSDMRAYTPKYVGQGIETFFGNKSPFLWWANGTGQGNYTNAINIAAGIGQIGDVSAQGVMDPTIFATTISVAGNPASWDFTNAVQDTGLILQSGQTFGSGVTLNFATMITNGGAGSGIPIVLHTVASAIAYTSTNTTAGLLPGWMYTIQDPSPNTLGFGVAADFGPGHISGNYFLTEWDINNYVTYFPVIQNGQFDHRYAGWKASSINHVTGAANFIGVTTVSNLQVTAGATLTGGVLSGNGSGLTNTDHAVLSAGSMTSMAQAATASSEYAPWFWAATTATTINNNKFRVPYGGFLTNFWVEDDTGLGVGTNVVYTIFTNGVACNLNATANGGGTAVGFSTSNQTVGVFIPAGTYLHFNMSNSCPSAPANQLMNWSVELYR